MGVLKLAARNCLQISIPLIPGKRRSTIIRSGFTASARSKPVLPSETRIGVNPSCSSMMPMVSRRLSSSSITRMFGMKLSSTLKC